MMATPSSSASALNQIQDTNNNGDMKETRADGVEHRSRPRRRSSVLHVVRAAASLAAAARDATKPRAAPGSRVFAVRVDLVCRADALVDDALSVALISRAGSSIQRTLVLEYTRSRTVSSQLRSASSPSSSPFKSSSSSSSASAFEAAVIRAGEARAEQYEIAHLSAAVSVPIATDGDEVDGVEAVAFAAPRSMEHGVLVCRIIVQPRAEEDGFGDGGASGTTGGGGGGRPEKGSERALVFEGKAWVTPGSRRVVGIGSRCVLPMALPRWRRALRDSERRDAQRRLQWAAGSAAQPGAGFCTAKEDAELLPADVRLPPEYIEDLDPVMESLGMDIGGLPSQSDAEPRVPFESGGLTRRGSGPLSKLFFSVYAAVDRPGARPTTAAELAPSSLDRLWCNDAELITELLCGANPSRLRLVQEVPTWFTTARDAMLASNTGSTTSSGGRARGEAIYVQPGGEVQGARYRMKMRALAKLDLAALAADGRLFELDDGDDLMVVYAGRGGAPKALFYIEEIEEGGLIFMPRLTPLCIQIRDGEDFIVPGTGSQTPSTTRAGAGGGGDAARVSADSSGNIMQGSAMLSGRASSRPGSGGSVGSPRRTGVGAAGGGAYSLAIENGWGWACAKSQLMRAHALSHIFVSLYSHCILAVEPYAISLYRNLHRCHPLHALLEPYLRYAIHTAVNARKTWYMYMGVSIDVVNGIAAKASSRAPLSCAARLEARGMAAGGSSTASGGRSRVCLLPSYPYVEDAALIAAAIQDYVCAVVEDMYANDEDVASDDELHAFMREAAHARGEKSGTDVRSRDTVTSLVSDLIYTATVEFNAHTARCWTSYSNPLLAPVCALRGGGPHGVAEAMRASEIDFVSSMPTTGNALQSAARMRLASTRQGVGEPLMSPVWARGEREAGSGIGNGMRRFVRMHQRFVAALEVCEEVIAERNRSRPHPYDTLLPSVMTRGMAL